MSPMLIHSPDIIFSLSTFESLDIKHTKQNQSFDKCDCFCYIMSPIMHRCSMLKRGLSSEKKSLLDDVHHVTANRQASTFKPITCQLYRFSSFSSKFSSFTYSICVFATICGCLFFAHKSSMVLAGEFPLLWLPTAGNLIDNDFRKAIIHIMKSIYDLSVAFYFNFNNASAFAWVYIMALFDFV